MTYTRRNLINDDIDFRLKKHGLNLVVSQDDLSKSPRIYAQSVIVGFDVALPELDTDKLVAEELVAKYCAETLNRTAESIFWEPVYLTDDDSAHFTISPVSNTYKNNRLVGFIYSDKKNVDKNLSSSEIDTQAKLSATEGFVQELADLTAWINGDVYWMSVYTKGANNGEGGLISSQGNNYGANIQSGIEVANKLITDVVTKISEAGLAFSSPYLCMAVLKLKVTNPALEVNQAPSSHIISRIGKVFDAQPAFGHIDYNRETGDLTIEWLISAMPLVKILASNTDYNLYSAIRQNIDEHVSGGMNPIELMSTLTESKPYYEWSSDMLSGLAISLMDVVSGINFVSIELMRKTKAA